MGVLINANGVMGEEVTQVSRRKENVGDAGNSWKAKTIYREISVV